MIDQALPHSATIGSALEISLSRGIGCIRVLEQSWLSEIVYGILNLLIVQSVETKLGQVLRLSAHLSLHKHIGPSRTDQPANMVAQ